MSNYKVFYQQIEESKRNSTFNLIHQLKTEEQMERQLKERVPSLETYQTMTEEEQNEFSQTLETLFGTTELWETVKTKHIVVIESSAEIGGTVFAFYDELEPKKETPITERIYLIYDDSTYGMFSPEGLRAFIKYQQEYKNASNINNTNVSLNLVKYRKIKWGGELSAGSKAMIAPIDSVNLNDTATIKGKNVTVFIEQYHELRKGINESAQKLLDALLITATESSQSDTMIKLPLSEYMEMRGLKDVKSIREQVNDDLAALYRLSFRFEGGKGKQQKIYELRLIQGKGYEMEEVSTGIVRGQIFARLSEDFFKIFKQYTLMFYPEEALKINTKYNPYSRYLLLKLAEHKKMNYGKNNERIVSVKTLLDVCTSHGMPTVEACSHRHVTQQIIDPFERELDYLQDKGLIQWHYCGVNGAEIEPYQNYEEFEAQRVYFDLIGYPREPAVPEKKPRKPRAPRKQNIKK